MRADRTAFLTFLLTLCLAASEVRALELVKGEIRITPKAPASRGSADVATAADGRFVVVWQEGGLTADPTKPVFVKARLFDAKGKPRGGEIQVTTHIPVYFGRPAVAMAPDGRFVVVWGGGKENPNLVFGRRYAANGQPLGPRFALSRNPDGQAWPDVAMAADGSFVAVWDQTMEREDPTDPDEVAVDVFFRRFGSDGRPLGPEALAVGGFEEQSVPRVAYRPDGSFIVACQDYGGEFSFYDVVARIFSSSGTPLGDEFRVNDGVTENVTQLDPQIAVAADGKFAIAWTDWNADFYRGPRTGNIDDFTGVAIRFYDADGTPLAPGRFVNTFLPGLQAVGAVSALQNGSFLVLWTSGANQDGDGFGIFGRVYGADGTPSGREIRINLSRTGSQVSPALAVAPNGKGVAVWTGPDGTGSGIFARLIASARSQ